MAHLIPIPLTAVTVALLIRARFRGARRQIALWKPLSTLLVILVAALSRWVPAADRGYTLGIVLALVLSLVGDVALLFTGRRCFLLGLASFALAHLVYSVLLTLWNGFQPADLITGALLLAAGFLGYRYLSPALGDSRLPVAVYVLVVCLMVNRAVSTLFGDAFTATQAWMISAGAFLFWVSDLMLGMNRYGRPLACSRFNLAFYYAGQTLFALSASYF